MVNHSEIPKLISLFNTNFPYRPGSPRGRLGKNFTFKSWCKLHLSPSRVLAIGHRITWTSPVLIFLMWSALCWVFALMLRSTWELTNVARHVLATFHLFFLSPFSLMLPSNREPSNVARPDMPFLTLFLLQAHLDSEMHKTCRHRDKLATTMIDKFDQKIATV